MVLGVPFPWLIVSCLPLEKGYLFGAPGDGGLKVAPLEAFTGSGVVVRLLA
jgi:hypothetical protein